MALVESTDIPLGSLLPSFTLSDPHGVSHASDTLIGDKGVLIAFTCNHCPYAIAIWPRLLRLSHYARKLGISTVAINPNIHPDYPEDSPEQMKEKINEWQIQFPYLIDETQAVAKQFKAECTPDLYLFSADKKLVYHGRLDDNWKDETLVKQQELKTAIDALAQGLPPIQNQKHSMGCSIKWK